MRIFTLSALSCLIFAASIFAQQKTAKPLPTAQKTPTKKTAAKSEQNSVIAAKKSVGVVSKEPKSVKTNKIKEVSAADWKKISDSVKFEDWEAAATDAAKNLEMLGGENEKKQAASLRYLYLYSLAGKVADGKLSFGELENSARNMIGKEFLPVSRQFLSDCTGKVNYICAQKNSDRILRVTSTDKRGSAVRFFEYTKLEQPFDIAANAEKIGFVGGFLKNVEIADLPDQTKVLRLIFERGYVRVATD